MYFLAQAANDLQKQTDAQLLALAMSAIKKWYPNAPNQVNYKRSSWSSDPYSLGAYPYIKNGASPKDCDAY